MTVKLNILAFGAMTLTCAAVAHGQNMILNGSFEDNTASGTMWNMTNDEFNATVANATAFGDANEIDLMLGASPYGLAPVDGEWKLGIHRQSGGATDAFAFHLSSPIIAGQTYTLEFWAHAVLDFDPGTEPIEIGISTSATSFGTLVYTSGQLSVGSWTQYVTDFVAPIDANYLTVRNSDGTPTWAHIDAFVLIPAPSAIALLGFAGLFARRRRR